MTAGASHPGMLVSIIIPVHDTVDTLPETLASLRAQRHGAWEAIVVDDGSTRNVAAVATATGDARVRVVRQPHAGVSAARNLGMTHAAGEWLLFLDADDWLTPDALERMTAALAADATLDAVHGGWARVLSDGRRTGVRRATLAGDLFPELARYCVFVIHSCIVRRALVRAVGGFDPTLRTNEDWDLWQRIARAGARFGAVADVVALYRTRAQSASMQREQLLRDALTVIGRGHAPDPRVPHPAAAHAEGEPRAQAASAALTYACWPLALAAGTGGEPAPLLALLSDVGAAPTLDAETLAQVFAEAVPLARGQPPSAWPEIWHDVERGLAVGLAAIEERSGAPELARRTRRAIETIAIDTRLSADAAEPDDDAPDAFATAPAAVWIRVGGSAGAEIDVNYGVPDYAGAAAVEHLRVHVRAGDLAVGVVSLPVCDGVVPARVLADAVAAAHGWELLRWLRARLRGASANTAARDDTVWDDFLRALWGVHDLDGAAFYDPQASPPSCDATAPSVQVGDDEIAVEVSSPLPALTLAAGVAHVRVALGGVALGIVNVERRDARVSAHALRAAISTAAGYELCVAAVRELLLAGPAAADAPPARARDTIGWEESPLRRVLAAAARRARTDRGGEVATTDRTGAVERSLSRVRAVTDGAPRAGLVMERRDVSSFGTSASRWGVLPAGAAAALRDAAAAAGERTTGVQPNAGGSAAPDAPGEPGEPSAPAWALYLPDAIGDALSRAHAAPRSIRRADAAQEPHAAAGARGAHDTAVHDVWGRGYFEQLFASRADPWGYVTPYEQRKYEQTLSLLPPGRIARALELGCAEGHFTVQLAPRVDDLLAADISAVALGRAAARCAATGADRVRFERLDFTRDAIPGGWDLIVCSEVLYFAHDRARLERAARALAAALAPGGCLIAAHAHLRVDQPADTAFDWALPFGGETIARVLAAIPGLVIEEEIRTPLYRILRLRRTRRIRAWVHHAMHRRHSVRAAEHAPPEPDVARHVVYADGAGPAPVNSGAARSAVTSSLPILVYHRVAAEGAAATAEWRIAPAALEEHLAFLQDAGYRSATMEEWHTAMRTRRPLEGRRVLITFDDGTRDFATHAWPLLHRYGFTATVFLVTDLVGEWNAWDARYGERVPLLSWDEIRALAAEGVEFGSHTAGHRPLAGSSPVDVALEAARSRAAITRALGAPPAGLAYPYGLEDGPAQHLVGAAGYRYAFTCRMRRARLTDGLLALPRILVSGSDDLEHLAAKLGREE